MFTYFKGLLAGNSHPSALMNDKVTWNGFASCYVFVQAIFVPTGRKRKETNRSNTLTNSIKLSLQKFDTLFL
jgi:hypothetical protein